MWPGDEHAISEARAASKHALTMVGEHERWLGTLGITSVGEFNRACIDGDVSQLTRVAEGFQEKRISIIADEIFICPLAQLPFDRANRVHASDVRLLRRIVRDRHGRGHDAAATIERWPLVRRGERRHIFPYQENANAVFDSSLIYELSVLRVFASRSLHEVPHAHPSFTTAIRLLEMLSHFVTIYPDHVPPTSLLREFIGGSGFEG